MMTTSWREISDCYRGRRVLVTGHTGFKGSWLCTWLLTLGAEVAGLALQPNTTPNLFEGLGLADRLASRIADIRYEEGVRVIFEDLAPEIVFHLAAQPLVVRSYTNPPATFATNILGTANVLDAARMASTVRAIVVVTTDKVYDVRKNARPYRELDPLGGLDPYSASKAAAELVAAVYQGNLCRERIAIATARGGNVIGGGDWSENRLVPDVIRGISADTPIVLRNPNAIRPWQHVLELCEAYIELGARLLQSGSEFAEAWNIGPDPGETVTVGELTNAILEICSHRHHPVDVQKSHFYEAHTLRLDISKALARLSWRPRLGIYEAVRWTALWYGEYYREPASARALVQDQIRAFTNLIQTSK